VVLAATARALGETAGVPALLERVVTLGVGTVPNCEHAAVSVEEDDDRPFISMATFDAGQLPDGFALDIAINVPLADGDTKATLTFYATPGKTFDDGALQLSNAYAAQAALAIGAALTHLRAGLQAEQLREAIESRDIIGQAKGVLMARENCNADEAFEILRRASQRENLKLREIAARVASHHSKPRAG